MKAFILSAAYDSALMPLTLTVPKPMLPIANRPLVEYLIALCKKHAVDECKLSLFHLPESFDRQFHDGSGYGVKISYSVEKVYAGTASSIRRVPSYFDSGTIVLAGDCLTNLDLTEMIAYHKEKKAVVTVAVHAASRSSAFGPVLAGADGAIQILRHGADKDGEHEFLANMGVYIIEPEALSLIPAKQEFEIHSDLLPALITAGMPVFAYHSNAFWRQILSIEDYWQANFDALQGAFPRLPGAGEQEQKGILIHPSVKIDKKTLSALYPPVIIGKDSEISSGVEIQGPAVIGEEVLVESNASIIKSVVFNNTYIGKGIEIKDSVVNKNYHISIPNKFGTYVDDDKVLKVHRIIPWKVKRDQFLINATDRIVGFFALLFLSPLFLLVAIAIKFDSPGPVFYVSKRLRAPAIEKKGRHWYVYFKEKAVKYYVFRTMYTDADRRVKELKNKYASGPFIKIENDPRITKVGNFLRKTSIDELPLFWNVLTGHMSLVGIWALPVYEAKHLLEKGLQAGEGDEVIDLSEISRLRFEGKLGIAGFWQARGRSNLTAEERAIHDSVQSVLSSAAPGEEQYLGQYSEFPTYKGYLSMLKETFMAVVKRTGAE